MTGSAHTLKSTLFAAALLAAASGAARAQAAQLADLTGRVAQYTLTPRGDVDGLILAGGTQVIVPASLSTQLIAAVRPGDSITIRGSRAGDSSAVNAVAVVNNTTGDMAGAGVFAATRDVDAQGHVKQQLHNPLGQVDGALLDDGTVIRLPAAGAAQTTALLTVGQPVYVRGEGQDGKLGKVIEAREIGPSSDTANAIEPARFER